ncbi:MAG: hypothetical protein M5R36_23640 [Deltaproteobacteria bacterium]|nr:hypothetical protein [Deltaproteobacteria bacterium]
MPRVEESLGTGSLGETGDPPKSWIERQSEWEDALPPYATPTPAPKNDEPQDEENKEDS